MTIHKSLNIWVCKESGAMAQLYTIKIGKKTIAKNLPRKKAMAKLDEYLMFL